MGFSVCCHFEDSGRDAWSGRERDLHAWLALLGAFGGERLAVVNLSDLDMPGGLPVFGSLEDFVAAYPEPMVQVELGGEPLATFEHPANCWYAFGGTTATLPDPDVEIERSDERAVFHPIHAAHVVLWDRHAKGLS